MKQLIAAILICLAAGAAQAGNVQVSCDKRPESDVKGYRVYRSTIISPLTYVRSGDAITTPALTADVATSPSLALVYGLNKNVVLAPGLAGTRVGIVTTEPLGAICVYIMFAYDWTGNMSLPSNQAICDLAAPPAPKNTTAVRK